MPLSQPTFYITQQMPYWGLRLNITNPPSDPSAQLNRIERKDPMTGDWEVLITQDPNENYIDYEIPQGVEYQYRVVALAGSNTATSNVLTAEIDPYDEWLLKDLDAISDSMMVDISNDRLNWSSEEVQASFNVIGGKFPLVVKDEFIKGAKWEAQFDFLSVDEQTKFEKLRHKQKVLLLQAPFLGLQWYFVFGTNGTWETLNPHEPWLRFSCEIIEVGRL